jgi:hypothetical protein
MAIPFNDNLKWENYNSTPDWDKKPLTSEPVVTSIDSNKQVKATLNELFEQTLKQPPIRGVQFIRDGARLVLKVPIRSICTPIVLSKNWKQRERAKINAKLTGYSLIQLISIPIKLIEALIFLITLVFSRKKANGLLNKSKYWTANIDGRTSQLEALKTMGKKNTSNKKNYKEYKDWLYNIDPILCRG